jgi:hypothetical protein
VSVVSGVRIAKTIKPIGKSHSVDIEPSKYDVVRKPPSISGAQADHSFAETSKNLLTSKVRPDELHEWVGIKI